MKGLTDRQQEVLKFIIQYGREHAYPPTIRELADHFGISIKGAYDHISALVKKGQLTRGRQSRTIELTGIARKAYSDTLNIPILGNIAAGIPIMAVENWDGEVQMPSTMLKKSKTYFALRVKGDSMINAGILDGDLAVIEQQETAQNGQIVVAMVNEAMTLKRFFKETNRVKLQAENPAYKPIYTRNVNILGKLSHILRTY
ncbi:MAG: transcriptional repressor LexA [Spirochaetaceae bacterium]|jgi:repressor LexA|nr:transcriptional repressor LexA [Spirochaetaceae bacterium]